MMFVNAFTVFANEIFSSTFAAWLMAFLIFVFLLCCIMHIGGDV